MNTTSTGPGSYIEELPSGIHTIEGAATSITAFVGWASQGPTDQAGLVLCWADYQKQFGGLDSRSLLGYSVNQFFLNGGQRAYIVRLIDTATARTASVTIGTAAHSLVVSAVNAGKWANDYQITIKNSATSPGRFQLYVTFAPSGEVVEFFANLSIAKDDPQHCYVVDVVANSSNYIVVTVPSGTAGPPSHTASPVRLGDTIRGDDGTVLTPSTSTTVSGDFEAALQLGSGKGGMNLLQGVDLFDLLCVPGEIVTSVLKNFDTFCKENRAFLIADADPGITDVARLGSGPGFVGDNSAFYFPWLRATDALAGNATRNYPPCGFVAGIYAATDDKHGVWKAPAGTEALLSGAVGVTVSLNDKQNGVLNSHAVNCIRTISTIGTVIWGARTAAGNDEGNSQWKYVSVRRLALFLETSLYRNMKWVVFESNGEPLWAQIRLNVGFFLQTLFRQGAFQGATPQQAYFVRCDSETTSPTDQDNGIVNVLVGFAPLKPSEFIVIRIRQITRARSSSTS